MVAAKSVAKENPISGAGRSEALRQTPGEVVTPWNWPAANTSSAVRTSSPSATATPQDPRGPGTGCGRLSARDVCGLHRRRRSGPRVDGGQGREKAAESTAATVPPEPADHRRTWASCPCPEPWRNCSLRSSASATRRAGIHNGNHQPSSTSGPSLRLGTVHRGAAGPAHPPRPHTGDERRELQAQAQQGNRRTAAT